MTYRFPKTISAARVATFVSTAAWIQGTSASEVSLPEEALNNFLRRHGVTTISRRQQPAPAPGAEEEDKEEEEEDEEESEEGEEEEDDDSQSSVDSPGSTPSDSMDDEDDKPSLPDSPQAGVASGPSGQPAIGSEEPPGLSTGARIAIGVWSAVAVVAIMGIIFFFCRRRRRAKMAQEEMNALRDEELARSQQQQMSEVGVPPPSVIMEPAHLRGGDVGDGGYDYGNGNGNGAGGGAGSVRAPSGQWMATPPWQEDPPTWRDSHPWGQSQPSIAVAPPNGLPSGVRPLFAAQTTKPGREVVDEKESAVFAYR